MNTQLFTDLAASEESSGYPDNARMLRAVPELVAVMNNATVALMDFHREAGEGVYPKLDHLIAEARAALAQFNDK